MLGEADGLDTDVESAEDVPERELHA
jgi:hypothetical protein